MVEFLSLTKQSDALQNEKCPLSYKRAHKHVIALKMIKNDVEHENDAHSLFYGRL